MPDTTTSAEAFSDAFISMDAWTQFIQRTRELARQGMSYPVYTTSSAPRTVNIVTGYEPIATEVATDSARRTRDRWSWENQYAGMSGFGYVTLNGPIAPAPVLIPGTPHSFEEVAREGMYQYEPDPHKRSVAVRHDSGGDLYTVRMEVRGANGDRRTGNLTFTAFEFCLLTPRDCREVVLWRVQDMWQRPMV
jgi:hypothetical protein